MQGQQTKQKQSGSSVASGGAGGVVDSAGISQVASGIALQSVDKITSGLNEFSLRVSKVLEIISTLAQFRQLQGSIGGLPRVTGLWEGREGSVDEEEGSSAALPGDEREGSTVEAGFPGRAKGFHGDRLLLSTLKEESVVSTGTGSSRGSGRRGTAAGMEEETREGGEKEEAEDSKVSKQKNHLRK